jgi:hypothetical protein
MAAPINCSTPCVDEIEEPPALQWRKSHSEFSVFELMFAGLAVILWLAMRWFYAGSYPWNSDEPQHLHVVWAWANGLLPYRDVFDNHTPLFHILSVPLFRILGERPDIVFPMRLAMIPLCALSLWCIYRIGANVFSPRAGLWSAVLLGFFPNYFFMMGQYRTDVLWTVLWLGSLVVLTGGSLTKTRLFFTGLIVGAAFGVSMKTTLLLIVMLAAGGMTWIAWRCFVPERKERGRTHFEILSLVASALGGLLLIPLLLLGFFAMKGALGPLYYCVIEHNTLPGEHTPMRLFQRLFSWGWLTLLPALALGVTTRPLFVSNPRRAAGQLFLIFSSGLFYPVLHGFWRIITAQDYVPWLPLLTLVITPQILLLSEYGSPRWLRWRSGFVLLFLLSLVAGELCWVLRSAPLHGRSNVARVETIAQVLQLSNPGEYVMDPKGDVIFRPRPYYYVLETLTRRRLADGLLKDELPQRLIETRTAIVKTSSAHMTPSSLAFVRENYLSVGYVSVLGKMLPPAENEHISFDIQIPGYYCLTSRKGLVGGILDGQPLSGARWLTAGSHKLSLTMPATEVAVVWARAVEKGFLPFSVVSPERREGNS